MLLHNPELITYAPDESFQDEVWLEVRTRLAELRINGEHLDLFTAYYLNNSLARQMSKRFLERGQHIGFEQGNPLLDDFLELLGGQQELGAAAVRVMQAYVTPSLTHYESLGQIGQEMERRRSQHDT